MLYSSNSKSSSSTLRPPTVATPPYVDRAPQLLTDGDLAGFPLSYQDQPNISARSSFSASTCSFDFHVNELSIDPLHTQEQRRRQPDLVQEQENNARIRMRSISQAEDLRDHLSIKSEELPKRPITAHISNLYDEEEAEVLNVRHVRERERSMAPSPESIRFSGESEKARRLSIRKVFVKKTSSIGTVKDMNDALSLSEKRTTHNSSRGSTLTTGTVFSREVPVPVLKQDYIDEMPSIHDVETCKMTSDVDKCNANGDGKHNESKVTYVEYSYPDGGSKAWLQVVAAFFILVNSWGLVVAYGVFQEYYTQLPSGPLASSSAISLIGSIQSFLVLFIGFFAGRLLDAGYFRSIMTVGTVFMVMGLFATGWCGLVYYRILLCQGVITGIGMGLLFTPSVTIVSTYFQKKRALASGIVASGSSLGGVIFPIIVRESLPVVGFRYTLIILSSIVLLMLIISNVLLKPRSDIPHRKSGQWLQLSAFKEPTYCFYVVGLFCAFLGLYMPFFYVEEWAVEKGFDGRYGGFRMYYLVSVMNASSAFGRIVPNIFADFLGPINTQLPSILISGVLILCWQSITTFPSLVIFVILYGFFSGCLVSLPPASVASLSPDLSFLGVRMGMMFSIASIGSLSGAPIAGAIIGRQNGRMNGAMIWSGVIMLVSVVLVGAARYARGKEKGGGWKLKI